MGTRFAAVHQHLASLLPPYLGSMIPFSEHGTVPASRRVAIKCYSWPGRHRWSTRPAGISSDQYLPSGNAQGESLTSSFHRKATRRQDFNANVAGENCWGNGTITVARVSLGSAAISPDRFANPPRIICFHGIKHLARVLCSQLLLKCVSVSCKS